MKVRVFFVMVLFAFVSCKASQKLGVKKSEVIQKKLDELVAANDIPGLNFSLIKSDGTQLDFSSGYENTTTKTKMKPSHFMLSGSIGKTYAVALLMQLVDAGKISLDDKILKHLPKEKWLNKIPNIDQMTIRMLLSHTSGLRRWVMKSEVWETLHKNPDKVWTYKDRFSFWYEACA